MRRSVILLAAISLLATACGKSGEPESLETTTTVAATAPAVVEESTTSKTQPTTTPEFAQVTTNLLGDHDDALDAAIGSVYEAALNPGQEGFAGIPDGLLKQFADRTPTVGQTSIAGDVYTGTVLDTDIAVAVVGEADLVLLVGDALAGKWDVVGARLTSLDEPAWFGEAPLQILIIGSDARPGQKVAGHRADSVHILSAIASTGMASIVGIPRDSWVEVTYESSEEFNGKDKLTHSMASKGPEVVVETVENLTGVEIDGYLLTGFLGFQQLIDAFDGFVIDVPYRMNDIKSFSNLYPGVQHLNGTQALAFSRNRANAPGGDFGRSFNHGLVMKAVLTEMHARGGPEQIPMLVAILAEFCETDLDAGDLLNLAATTLEIDPGEITNIVVPGTVGFASGRSVVFLDDEAYGIFADIADDGVLTVASGE